MTIDDLKAVRRQRLRVDLLQQRIEALRSRAEYTSRQLVEHVQYDATRDRLAEYVAELDALETALTVEVIDLERRLQAVDDALDALPHQQSEVLRLRYCEGLSWHRIARRTNYSMRQCERIAAQGMDRLRPQTR